MKNGIAVKMDPQVPSEPSLPPEKIARIQIKKEAVRFNKTASFSPNFLYGLSIFEYSSVFIHFIKRIFVNELLNLFASSRLAPV